MSDDFVAATKRATEATREFAIATAMLPVDVQMRADAELGAAWRRCEAALPWEWAILLTYCADDGPPIWHVSAGEDIRTSDPALYFEGQPAAALTALAEKLEALRDD